MKKYLILSAAALLALAACTKQVPVAEDQREISFQVANFVQTKADNDAETNQTTTAAKPGEFTNADFGAYCWRTPEAGASEAVEYFSNERVASVVR